MQTFARLTFAGSVRRFRRRRRKHAEQIYSGAGRGRRPGGFRRTGAEKLIIAGRDGGYAQALSKAVDLYKAKNPGLEVERLELPYGGLYEKATISLREKAGAYDVVMMDDTWAVEFMSNGWLADLDKLGGGADADFVKPAVDVSRYPVGSGPLYALPFVGNVELFAYRKDLFEKYGFGTPKSWTDVVNAAKTISEKEAGVSGVVYRGIKANPIVTGFLPILWAHGARIVDDKGRRAWIRRPPCRPWNSTCRSRPMRRRASKPTIPRKCVMP